MQHTCFVVDIEADGPNIWRHSMVWFGAVVLTEGLTETFEGKVKPITQEFLPQALAVTSLCRSDTLLFPLATETMPRFKQWVLESTRPGTTPQVWSDNNGFDLARLNYYLDRFAGGTPFGHSSRNLSDQHKGLVAGAQHAGRPLPQSLRQSFTCLQKTPHDHNPVNDALGNAEALLQLRAYGLQIDVH